MSSIKDIVSHRINREVVVLVILLFAVGISFFIVSSSASRSGCLRLRAGTVGAKVEYPSHFFSYGYPDAIIQLWKQRDADQGGRATGGPVLDVRSRYYESVESIVDNSKIEPGPEYETSTFNGYIAAHSHSDDKFGIYDEYEISIGNRVIEIGYHPSDFNNIEQAAAEKMLHGIIFTEEKEDLAMPRVENCRGS